MESLRLPGNSDVERLGHQREQKRMIESLIQKIEDHPKYGPAMAGAVTGKLPLVLNYHTHTAADDYCVSICSKTDDPIGLIGTEGELGELVHIRAFGKTEAECLPLTTTLARALHEHYGLDDLPEIYLNGKPLPESPLNEGGSRA